MKTVKLHTNECQCELCISMCMTSPCIPTPSEAAKIEIRFPGTIIPTIIGSPETGETDIVMAPKGDRFFFKGRQMCQCHFLTEEGKCRLHELKMKPIEGRMMHHEIAPLSRPLRQLIIKKFWRTPEALETIKNHPDYLDMLQDVKETADMLGAPTEDMRKKNKLKHEILIKYLSGPNPFEK